MIQIRGLQFTKLKGGEGSGFHGHAGRPGSVGGSAPGIKGNYSNWDFDTFKRMGAEMVPLSFLDSAKEFERELSPLSSDIGDLARDIERSGLREELILDWSEANNRVFIGEGNHRLAALKRLGYSHAPARVVKSRLPNKVGVEVPGKKPDKYGWVSAIPFPSVIGVSGAISIEDFVKLIER